MKEQTRSAIRLLEDLTERAKELTCLYAIEEALKNPDAGIDQVARRIIEAIPPGWQFPEICVARISLEGSEYQSENFQETPWKLSADIVQQDEVVGTIAVYYTQEPSVGTGEPFLNEERRLIQTIADRLNHFLTYRKMSHVFHEWQSGGRDLSEKRRGDWEAVLDLIRQTDHALFLRISNKMLNHLCWSGIDEALPLRRSHRHQNGVGMTQFGDELNAPGQSRVLAFSAEFTQRLFRIASEHLSNEEILTRLQMWIREDKLGALLRTARSHLPLSDVASAIHRYLLTTREEADSHYPLARGLKVLLIETVLSSRLDYVKVAKEHVGIEDLYGVLQKTIFSAESHGRLGAKGAGFFLTAQILSKANNGKGADAALRIPKTWYIASDMMLEFIHFNNMDEVVEQKYKEIERVRVEYGHVVDMFKQAAFPPEMISGLSMALDDFGERPLIVRGSSLLEDRTGIPCVRKHTCVFLGNQGSREVRLKRLMQAVAEVYACNFGPRPIEHRAEHGLLELSEQMGVLIQEVVGTKIGSHFFPAFSGVARSRNDLQWFTKADSEGGILRIVPGLGCRKAEGVCDKHPITLLPGSPRPWMGTSPQDWLRHTPRSIDVINLETNCVETVALGRFLKEFGLPHPQAEQILSVVEDGDIRPFESDDSDHDDDRVVVSFEGLISRSPFQMQIRSVLRTLEQEFGGPVEVEFASDGTHLYVLQCRAQGMLRRPRPAPIPKGIEDDKVVFSANRFVSNGRTAKITHIVYVHPAAYEVLGTGSQRQLVEAALSMLNELLPKRQYMFIGPIRDDVEGVGRVGVDIEHTDVSNAAALVELIESGEREPSLPTAGAHLLLDLMESDIHYLPLFRDAQGSSLNEFFLTRSKNLLPELLPEFAHLSEALRIIDVADATKGKAVQVLMNADLGEAVAVIVDPNDTIEQLEPEAPSEEGHPESYWRWRYRMAEQIASHLDAQRFGVSGFYLIGSTKNGTAGPGSDIDVLVHFKGTRAERKGLMQWLEGWSLCLDEINYLRTGYRSGGLLDVHIVTDDDIARKTSFAVKINAITDAARPLKMKDVPRPGAGAKRDKSRERVN